MYMCLKKVTYESNVPTALQSKLGNGTWKEAAFNGLLGIPRMSPNGSYVIVKGEFSMKEGQLTSMASLGDSMDYPDNTILTKSEAQALVRSETWTNA